MTPTVSTAKAIFDAAYWASQPPQIAALQSVSDSTQRESNAAGLATQGYVIDIPIMVWLWDPYIVMSMRQQFGYTWVPSALQPPLAIQPGLVEPGVQSYDPNNPPAGSIKVSTNPADFPPFNPPATTSTAPVSDPVGAQALGNIFLSVVGDTYPDGAKFTDSRGTFQKRLVATPFGRNAYWEKVG